MKSLACFDQWGNSPMEVLEFTQHRLDVCFTLLDKLRDSGEMSSAELNRQTKIFMEEEGYSICPFFDHFWHDYIRTQVRAEEFIRVHMKKPIYGKVTKTHDENMVIFTPNFGYNPQPYIVYNPQISKGLGDDVYVQGDRIIQVRVNPTLLGRPRNLILL